MCNVPADDNRLPCHAQTDILTLSLCSEQPDVCCSSLIVAGSVGVFNTCCAHCKMWFAALQSGDLPVWCVTAPLLPAQLPLHINRMHKYHLRLGNKTSQPCLRTASTAAPNSSSSSSSSRQQLLSTSGQIMHSIAYISHMLMPTWVAECQLSRLHYRQGPRALSSVIKAPSRSLGQVPKLAPLIASLRIAEVISGAEQLSRQPTVVSDHTHQCPPSLYPPPLSRPCQLLQLPNQMSPHRLLGIVMTLLPKPCTGQMPTLVLACPLLLLTDPLLLLTAQRLLLRPVIVMTMMMMMMSQTPPCFQLQTPSLMLNTCGC